MGGKGRKKLNKSNSGGPRGSASSSGLFVEGGLLSDWSAFSSPPSRGRKLNNGGNGISRSGTGRGSNHDSIPGSGSGRRSESAQIRNKAIGYMYPQENAFIHGGENRDTKFSASKPVVTVGSEKSPIAVYLDAGPVKESQNAEYMYDYTTSFTLDESSHRGLGFYDEMEATPHGIGSSSKMEEQESDSMDLSSSDEFDVDHGANDEIGEVGYVLIGGTKIFTQDITDEDEDEDEGEEEDSSDEESSGSEDCSETSDSDVSSYSGSDVDDEVAADYFEGIGGISNIVNVDQLIGQVSGVDDDSDSDDSFDGTLQKLGGIDLQEASMEYGMKKPIFGRKYIREGQNSTPVRYGYSSALDDLMLIKDPRTFSGKKKYVARLPQSWPAEARKSKKLRRIPGEKKRHRKETIAAKRRDRMIHRGVDLQKINLKLQQTVLDGVDMQAFPPMQPRDCSQVRRLAAIYRLRSLCQGTGKKRFVTVVRTQHTCMPSASDKMRLEKLIGGDDEDANFSVVHGKPRNTHVAKQGSQSFRKKSSKNLASCTTSKESKKNKTGKVGSYAAQTLSFVSSGVLNAELIELTISESNETIDEGKKLEKNAVECGAFEMHTTGFGSKMLAKMGYVEGSGLGKDGQGMANPIEVFQRPKSLGLGAQAPETSDTSKTNTKRQPKSSGRKAKSSSGTNGKAAKNENDKVGSFEKHTKGFGSKMMTKMGFVEGMGLGKDSQGIVNPLVAVRRPKSMGLGAST